MVKTVTKLVLHLCVCVPDCIRIAISERTFKKQLTVLASGRGEKTKGIGMEGRTLG